MSGGASILSLPEYTDEESTPSKTRSAYKPSVSLSAKRRIEPPSTSEKKLFPTQNDLELYSRLRSGGMEDEQIFAEYPELNIIREKQERDRQLQNAANTRGL